MDKIINFIKLHTMQFPPRIRNFKIKKLERIDAGSTPEIAHSSNGKLQTITHIVEAVLDRINGEDMFRPEYSNKRKDYTHDKNKDDILISNKDSSSDGDYDAQFIERMDPRDKVISVGFHFLIPHSTLQNYQVQNIFSSQFFKAITKKVEQYLVNMLEIVVSVSFNELMDGKLKENQCKDYASKNIILNVHSICKQTFKALKERMLIEGVESEFSLALIQLVDHTLSNSVKSLAPYYPQAPPTGKTPRIRQALLAIDRNYNSELDFLFTQNLTLQREPSGDYTQYIMRVINQAILVTSEVEEDDFSQLTLFEKFRDFMENLIWISKQDCYAKVINICSDRTKKKGKQITSTQQIPNEQANKYSSTKRNLINKFFRDTNISNATQVLRAKGQKNFQMSQENREKQIAAMKKNHEVQVGQKLPASIEIFSKNDMKDRNFSAKHSSVLRVITKWAQNLQAIFQNAQKFVLNRNYTFTTLSGKSIYPTTQLKQHLYQQIRQVKQKKNKIESDLVAKNKIFQSYFLSNSAGDKQNITRFIKRYTQTRVVASKMNTLIIKFMEEYVSALINLLIQAGKMPQAQSNTNNKNDKKGEIEYINLISFRIGDLMRARMHVNEATFIRILRTLYLLDESQVKQKPFFQLVRVKNKLEQKDNNVLINFLFKGKIQCELQISSQKIEGKQQKYYAFSHFLYELSRGSFGILSQCAIIISQHDPIASSPSYYEAKKFMPIQKNIMTEKVKQILEGKNSIFICVKCNRLITNQNKNIFQKSKSLQNTCNSCFIKYFNKKDYKSLGIEVQGGDLAIQNFLSNPELSAWMSEVIDSSQIKKLSNYGQLSAHKQISLLFSINQKYNEVDYDLLVYDELDFQWNIVHLNDNILCTEEIQDEDFDMKNITSKVKGNHAFKELTYIELSLNKINMADLIKAKRTIPSEINIVNKLYQIEEKAKLFIARGDIEDILKNKNQTIAFNKNVVKKDVMEELSQSISNINHIEYIFAEELELQEIPKWIQKTDKIKLLNLNKNSLKECKIIQKMDQLKELYLDQNSIEEINLTDLVKLQKISLYNNQTSSFICSALPNLLQLNLSANKIHQIDLSKFPALQNLNLSSNGITTLKTQKMPQNLEQLTLSYNRLTPQIFNSLPHSLKKLKIDSCWLKEINHNRLPRKLVELDVSGNQLQSLEIGNMPLLNKLNASYNNSLATFNLKNTPQLTELSMDRCKIKSFQTILMPLGMQWISFCNNEIEQVLLRDMTNIQNFNLTGNKVKKLELKNCKVKILTLYQNNLQSLDNIIVPYTVQRLFLKDNKLTSATLKNLPFLEILNIQSNQLTALDIDGMPNLKELALDFNRFTSIDNINIPQKLERLFVRGSKLQHLNLSDLRELTICVLDQNPLTKVSLKNMPKLNQVGLMRTRIESSADIDLPNTVGKIFMHYNLLKEVTYKNMPNLSLIVHQGNQLTEATLQNLPNLKDIYFNQNHISRLHLKKLPKLQKLVLPSNQISEIVFKDMPFLKNITLTNNKLTEINLDSVSLVETVAVSGNKITEINFKDLTGLVSLNISSNKIQKCKLYNLPMLNDLSLSCNEIKQAKFYKLKSLKSLELSDNPIQIIELVDLRRLETITLSTIKIKTWNLENLPKLKYLTISSSQIQQINFKKMDALQDLSFYYNQLKSCNFKDLPKLFTIICSDCKFESIYFEGLKNLSSINFDRNQLTKAELIDLPRLWSVNLRQNQLTSIKLLDLPKLNAIYVSNNKLTQLDISTANSKESSFIYDVSDNPIKEFQPHPFTTQLFINNTQIGKLQLKDMTNLSYFQAMDSPLLREITIENCPLLNNIECSRNPEVDNIRLKKLPILLTATFTDTIFKNFTVEETPQKLFISTTNAQMQELIKTQNPGLVARLYNPQKYVEPDEYY